MLMRVLLMLPLLCSVGRGTVWGQGDRTCRPELVSVGGIGRSFQVAGGVHQFANGGVFARCIGQSTTVHADSVAWYSERDRMDFTGSVRFGDSSVTLESDRASYYTKDERLEAFGNVRLVNLETGSVLTGPRLTYYRDVEGVRDTSEVFATGRPRVEYRGSVDTTGSPYVIVADRVRLKGEGGAWVGGSVTIDRDDFAARGDSARLDADAGRGFLVGNAEAAGRDSASYVLRGRRIAFRLDANRLRWLQAQQEAEATSNDWQLTGDTIEFVLANDLIQRGAAWGDSIRPEAVSLQQTITADSLAIDAPDQVLTEVRGIGDGLARTRPDSGTVAEDWLAGDTVVARFDSTDSGGRTLAWLLAIGEARAFYHVYEDSTRTGLPAINYARGRRITVTFRNDLLERVDIVDAADGVYLEPPGVKRP